ncbi:MAG: DUF2231 domain-containing protein [Alphaproteobacteria bacterium]|nr:DUF2231 domain-containing protein [Alphaproteobacteria bacterium]MBU0796719.1 DUF2231 domain-containing protein [Alphaproteobacteria bacterium]MBU0888268.1 DUF2231 domain-containing protein [Alphaproteobacteria bacterium]MBU2089996.1 DUF2231 domain-containing protein [Alphaproteobacteria bacterium]
MDETGDKKNPVTAAVGEQDITSAVAIAGHPLHAMSVHFPIALVMATLGADIFYWWSADPFWIRAGLWSAGFAFASGVVAGVAGTAELLLVSGIRARVASWTHAIAAMMLLSVAGANWGLRLADETAVLPHGLMLSVLAAVLTGLAGWHGGKLIFHHGVGLMVSAKD